MKNEGWSWGDLVGELYTRGVDIDDVSDDQFTQVLSVSRVEDAADRLCRREHARGSKVQTIANRTGIRVLALLH